MNTSAQLTARRINGLSDLLDIPERHYQLARDRYISIAKWLSRPESTVEKFSPWVYTQGSFRYGTVNRPINKGDEYDLDMVVELVGLPKKILTQRQLKEMVGGEISAYAKANGIKAPIEEKHRCWRLEYADEVSFHIDVLPAVPEDAHIKQLLAKMGVQPDLAAMAIAITDDRHPHFEDCSPDRPTTNPNGYAGWFKSRMRMAAERQLRNFIQAQGLASVDDVPTWRWKTPLQRVIQILKRHRDVYFAEKRDLSPISMILTTLAGHAYHGEENLYDALVGIVDRMGAYVNDCTPRVPNPSNFGDDFAECWESDDRLENAFWSWHQQLGVDIEHLGATFDTEQLQAFCENKFNARLSVEDAYSLRSLPVVAAVPVTTPTIITTTSRPWARC